MFIENSRLWIIKTPMIAALTKDSSSNLAKWVLKTNPPTTLEPTKCIGLSLYIFVDDRTLDKWSNKNPMSDDEVRNPTIQFIERIPLPHLDSSLLDLATLIDDIIAVDVFRLEIDGTQLEESR